MAGRDWGWAHGCPWAKREKSQGHLEKSSSPGLRKRQGGGAAAGLQIALRRPYENPLKPPPGPGRTPRPATPALTVHGTGCPQDAAETGFRR